MQRNIWNAAELHREERVSSGILQKKKKKKKKK